LDFDENNRRSLNKKRSPNYFEKPKHIHSGSEVQKLEKAIINKNKPEDTR
jgi:hypothetical protein